jgi:membrane protein
MTILYLFLPRTRIRIKAVVFGALFASTMFEIAKHIFTIYVVRVVKFGTIYGPISAFIIFLLWVFYSSTIFLVGAEIVHKFNKNKLQT